MSESKKLIPRRRFHSFIYSDDWSLTRLENLGNFNPSSILPNQFEYVDLESVIGNQMVSHRTVDRKQAPSRAQRLAKKGDIFYQTVRPYQQNNYFFNLLEENYVFSTGYAQIRPFGDGYFLFTKLQERKFLLEVLDNCIGTSFPAINSTALAKIRVFTPLNIEEQYNIGNFFQKLDNLINTQQKKLEKTKTLKSAYLTEMFPNEGELKPRLRFIGFIKDWKLIKLGEAGSTTSGIGFPDSEQGGEHGIPFYKVSDMNKIGNEIEMKLANNYVTSEQISNRKWNPITTIPAIIFAKVGAAIMLNRKRLVRTEFLIDNNMMAYIFDNTWNINFGKVLFETINLAHYSQVGALPSYNSSDIEKIDITFPNTAEQTKIGNFFKLLDDKIALEQKKLDKLKNIKQAYLNEMFV
ncbi:restriction endonuclease subunit S [Gilliamella sp. ESL0254]|uniref:restriction endonuclease subunit S n=1 Tax=Gilliamella sp. ESL0254 TaxID=2705035 RepID=UPI001933A7E8|nr:restriction endonuclease subunit S [Gilliamella sp. ESL0254]